MDITAVVGWFQLHWSDITGVIAYIIAGASIVVKLTPQVADDNALKSVIKFVGKFIALNR